MEPLTEPAPCKAPRVYLVAIPTAAANARAAAPLRPMTAAAGAAKAAAPIANATVGTDEPTAEAVACMGASVTPAAPALISSNVLPDLAAAFSSASRRACST